MARAASTLANPNALSELAYAIGLANGTLMAAAMTIDMTPEQKSAMEAAAKRLSRAYDLAFNTPVFIPTPPPSEGA